MSIQRVIEFETTTDEGATRVTEALGSAFRALSEAQPEGVRLAYWRVPNGRRFMALIELVDENANPLVNIEAARSLRSLIGEWVDDGYPRPLIVETVGTYGFELRHSGSPTV